MKAFSDVDSGLTEASAFLNECRAQIDDCLNHLVPFETTEPVAVHSAMRWSLFAGGKRFRPALLMAVGETFAAPRESLLFAACAFEMIHTYSLIHDDLPSMDDDELRRGRPTCHVQFGEAIAILAGDALQTLAFQAIAGDTLVDPERRLRVIGEVARAAGTPAGMIAGQAHDLEAQSRINVSDEELETVHRKKTGAMIVGAARCGAIIASAEEKELEVITRYATELGLLFQITDDLLDVTATAADLGKTPGKDERANKATYPALYGLEDAREQARTIHFNACRAIDDLERSASSVELLRQMSTLVLKRSA